MQNNLIQNNLIYDVGAHKGQDASFYLAKGFKVVAVEASPTLCDGIKNKLAQFIDGGTLIVINAAIAESQGKIDFYENTEASVWNTANRNWVERNITAKSAGKIRKITVNSSSLADIMATHGVPYYCKIDIEGNDFLALKSLRNCDAVPRFLSIESEKLSWSKLIQEFETFRELGYSRYKIIDQELVELHVCPYPAREGNYCAFNFEKHNSGLFGEELPGRWLDMSEAIEAYKSIFRGYALNGDSGFATAGGAFDTLLRIWRKMRRGRRSSFGPSPIGILPPAGWYDTHATM